MFGVVIEEQDSQDKVDTIESKVMAAIIAVTGVDTATLVDSDIDEEDDEPDTDVDNDG